MIIIGDYFDRVDTPEGMERFKSIYRKDYLHYLNHSGSCGSGDGVTILKNPQTQYVARIEGDEDCHIYQLYVLQNNDEMTVFTDGCMQNEGRVFNSDGFAFFILKEDGINMGTYCITNSPYDLSEEDGGWDTIGAQKEQAISNVKQLLKDHNLPDLVNNDNIIFFTEL